MFILSRRQKTADKRNIEDILPHIRGKRKYKGKIFKKLFTNRLYVVII